MEQILMQLQPIAQQYMQTQSPQAAAQLLQMIAQSGDPQLTMMVADQIAQMVLQASQDQTQSAPAQPGAMVPQGATGMQIPIYKKGGKLTAVEKMVEKRKKGKK